MLILEHYHREHKDLWVEEGEEGGKGGERGIGVKVRRRRS